MNSPAPPAPPAPTTYLSWVLKQHLSCLLPATPDLTTPVPGDKALVFVEPRRHPMFQAVLYNHLHFLGPGWTIRVFTGKGNMEWVNALLPHGPTIQVTELETTNLTREEVTSLYLSPSFWESIPEENILMSQCDCIMFRPLPSHYLGQYDFIGANLRISRILAPNAGGIQGGFSLRKKSAMLDCLRRTTWDQIQEYRQQHHLSPIPTADCHEDVFFTHACEMLHKTIPHRKERDLFSVEGFLYLTPVALHGTDKGYIPEPFAEKMVKLSEIHFPVRLYTYGDQPEKIRFLYPPYENLGQNKKYQDTFSKMEALEQATFQDTDIVCFVDGYDVMQMAPLQEIYTKFLTFQADLVVATETHCWPSPWMAHLFPPSPTKYRFPNIGTYIGYGWAIRKMLNWEKENYRQAYDDQGYFHDFYLRNKDPTLRIALDTQCLLFQCMTFVPWSDLAYENGRCVNQKLGTRPCFIHFNGKSDLLRDGRTSVMDRIAQGAALTGLLQFHNTIEG